MTSRTAIRILRWGIVAILVAGAIAFIAKGANQPRDPYLKPATGAVHAGRIPFGDFGQVSFHVDGGPSSGAAARTAIRCALLAATEAQRERGLMDRSDLGGYDGMLFRFDADVSNVGFYMKDTPLPLTVAWFDSGGQFVGSADMDPCLNQPSCPIFSAPKPYRFALEVPKGNLAQLGIGTGSRLVIGGTCP